MSATALFSLATLAIGVAFVPIAAHAQTLTTLYSFKGGTDGAYPAGSLLYNGGLLYGVTDDGGGTHCHQRGCGVVYSADPSTGSETIIASLRGGGAFGGLVFRGGKLYGTDYVNSLWPWGAVFKVDIATGRESSFYQFEGAPDAANPSDTLIYHNAIFYGTTSRGGVAGVGTVFAVNAHTGAESVIYSFAGGADGGYPFGGLLFHNNILYGTTSLDGTYGGGTVFSIDTATGAETVLHSFGGKRDGANPYCSLIFDHGLLYGTTGTGGTSNRGTVFKIRAATGAETIIHDFTDTPDGDDPYEMLTLQGGDLYGITPLGGTSNMGTVFTVNVSTGVETVLYSFSGGADGGAPQSPLIYQDGVFYGTTALGGSSRYGTVFELVP